MLRNDYNISGDNSLDLNKYLANNGLIQIRGHPIGSDANKSLSFNDFLNFLITNVVNSSDKCDVWSDVLLDVIDNNVVNESMLSQVLSITISKSKCNNLGNRVFSCKMFGKISRRFNQMVFINTIYPLVKNLCNDCQPSVRAHLSKQLSSIALNKSSEIIKNQILPLITQLSNDREVIVRIATIESLIDLIPKLDQQFNKEIVLPQIVLFFSSALEVNDSHLGLIFMNFGKLCQTLPKEMISNEKWFLDYYFNVFLISNDFQFKAKDITFNERDIHCRNLLALFLPILLQIYGPNESLNSVLNFLCSDIEISVVRTIASVFNQINIHLKNAYKLYPQLSKLLNSRNAILAKELMPFLSDLLIDAINCSPNDNKDMFLEDIIRNLMVCENTIHLSLDWRLQISFFENLTKIMPFFTINQKKTHFIPLLTNRILTSRPLPVRIDSSRCLLSLFRDSPLLLKDINIYEWFVTTLCNGKSCSQRMLFLNVCELVSKLCETKISIKYFFEPMLSLRRDKVPNIRLNVCKKLITFKSLLTVPEIMQKIETIKEMFKEMLATECDRDVIESINVMIDELNWRSDSRVEDLTQDFVRLNIDNTSEVNNNSIEVKESDLEKSDSIKLKSCLPQLIRSQPNNNNLILKSLPINRSSDDLIPSRIPKPITKCSK